MSMLSLNKKLNDQQSIISKLEEQSRELQRMTKELHTKIQQKSQINQQQPSDRIQINPQDKQKLAAQLRMQAETADNMLKNYEIQYKKVTTKYQKISTTALDQLQSEISQRRQFIKGLKDEMKNLEFIRRKQEKAIEKNKKMEDGAKLAKLVEEVKKHKQIYERMKEKNKKKNQTIKTKSAETTALEKRYKQVCRKNNIYPEEVKPRKKTKSKLVAEKQAKKIVTVRDIVSNQATNLRQNIQYNRRTLDELNNRKDIIVASLQNAQKKYSRQIGELRGRLEDLEIQNKILMQTLRQKQNELKGEKTQYKKYHSAKKLTPIS